MYCWERPNKFKLSVVRTVGTLCAMRSYGVISWLRACERCLLHRRFGSRAERILVLVLHGIGICRAVQAGCGADDGLISDGAVGLLLSLARVIVMRAITSGEQPVACQRECSNDQHTDQQDHGGHEDGHNLGHGRSADDRATGLAYIVDDGN